MAETLTRRRSTDHVTNTFSFSWRGQVEFITCFGGDSDPEALNGSPKKKKNKKKKKTKKAYRDPIGKECRNC